MSELFIGEGQSPLGSVMVELAPPVIVAPPIAGGIDFDLTGGQTTGASLSLEGAGHAATGGLVRLVQYQDAAPPAARVLTARHARLGPSGIGDYTDLDLSYSREWTDPLIDVGAGRLRLPYDEPGLDAFEWDGNDLVQFRLNDVVAYTITVERPERVTIDPAEEAGQGWQIHGRGHLALLERAVVYPQGGVGGKPAQEDRVWDWTNIDYPDNGWGDAHIVTYVYWIVPAPWGGEGQWGLLAGSWDPAFSDKTAAVLWSNAGTIVTAPVGKVYGRQLFYMDALDPHAYFQGEADNACDFYLNGALILSTTNYAQVGGVDVSVPAGWNMLATVCENRPPAFAANPAGWAWALYDYGYPPLTYAKSGPDCKILAYPSSVPGMSVGLVMRLVVEEAQDRGALPWLDLQFTDSHDSDGRAWPKPEISTKVGTDLFTFFSKELAETYIDLWMAPGSTKLYAYNKGGRGSSSGVDLTAPTDPDDPTSGNLTALTHRLAT